MRARARRAASGPRAAPRRFFHLRARKLTERNRAMNFQEKLDSFFFFHSLGERCLAGNETCFRKFCAFVAM